MKKCNVTVSVIMTTAKNKNTSWIKAMPDL